MLRTRLWMGTILTVLGVGILVVDHAFAPYFPVLFVVVLGMGLFAAREIRLLMPADRRPLALFTYLALGAILASYWHSTDLAFALFIAAVMAALIAEVAIFRADGNSTPRAASTVLILGYLGLLGGCLARLRWVEGPPPTIFGEPFSFGALALAFAFFVPKAGDIGAYACGHAFGRHKFAPLTSPKKTWEGAVGGLLGSVLATFALSRLTPLFDGKPLLVIGFGITIGVASQLGDLSESILKRDGQSKDASKSIPGFGGVLDVIDSVLFAAPVTLGGLWVIGKWVNS